MDELTRRVLKMFSEMGSESLDLHTLFEAGGNDPDSRKRVLDVVMRLVDTGYLESRGSDFYLLRKLGVAGLPDALDQGCQEGRAFSHESK